MSIFKRHPYVVSVGGDTDNTTTNVLLGSTVVFDIDATHPLGDTRYTWFIGNIQAGPAIPSSELTLEAVSGMFGRPITCKVTTAGSPVTNRYVSHQLMLKRDYSDGPQVDVDGLKAKTLEGGRVRLFATIATPTSFYHSYKLAGPDNPDGITEGERIGPGMVHSGVIEYYETYTVESGATFPVSLGSLVIHDGHGLGVGGATPELVLEAEISEEDNIRTLTIGSNDGDTVVGYSFEPFVGNSDTHFGTLDFHNLPGLELSGTTSRITVGSNDDVIIGNTRGRAILGGGPIQVTDNQGNDFTIAQDIPGLLSANVPGLFTSWSALVGSDVVLTFADA